MSKLDKSGKFRPFRPWKITFRAIQSIPALGSWLVPSLGSFMPKQRKSYTPVWLYLVIMVIIRQPPFVRIWVSKCRVWSSAVKNWQAVRKWWFCYYYWGHYSEITHADGPHNYLCSFLGGLRVTNPTIRLTISVCSSVSNVLIVWRAQHMCNELGNAGVGWSPTRPTTAY